MLQELLEHHFSEEILEDAFSRGRYSTDASIYQMMSAAVAVPRSKDDISTTFAAARQIGMSVTGRGGGTSQCVQTGHAGEAILAGGTKARFAEWHNKKGLTHPAQAIIDEMLKIGSTHAKLIDARYPKLNRRVGGYNLDALVPDDTPINLSHLVHFPTHPIRPMFIMKRN